MCVFSLSLPSPHGRGGAERDLEHALRLIPVHIRLVDKVLEVDGLQIHGLVKVLLLLLLRLLLRLLLDPGHGAGRLQAAGLKWQYVCSLFLELHLSHYL